MKFKNDIEAQAGFKDAGGDLGVTGQLLSSTGTETNWIDQNTIASGSAEVVEVPVKNLQGSALTKGDPVYISGSVGASGILEVQLADAGNAAKMPAVGLLKQDLAANAQGFAVVTGKLRNLITSPIDGVTPNPNTVIYVKSGGSAGAALTTVKPGGSTNFIQNVGKVGRPSTSSDGALIVSSILRSNDVPNLPLGRLFVGTNTNTSLASDVVYIDDANDRVGVGTTSPDAKLHVNSENSQGTLIISRGGDNLAATNNVGRITFPADYNGTPINYAEIKAYANALSAVRGSLDFNVKSTSGAVLTGMTVYGTSSGVNVGIGTTSPGAKLDVREYVDGNETYINAGLTATNPTRFKVYNENFKGALSLYDAGNIEDVKITTGGASWFNGGNVGIGTTSPSEKLTISASNSGAANNNTLRFVDTDVTTQANQSFGKIEFETKDTNNPGVNAFINAFAEGTGGTGALSFGTGSGGATEKMRITSGGNVGIGTTSPVTKLMLAHYNDGAVGGTIRIKDRDTQQAAGQLTGAIEFESQDATEPTSGVSTAIKAFAASSTGGSYLTISTTDISTSTLDERIRITSTGNVGIGTNSPDFKLDVDGTFGVSDLPFNSTSVSVLVADEITGVEEVTNGSFTTDANWNKNPNWTISGGTANADGTSNQDMNQIPVNGYPVVGEVFRVSFEITARTQGQVRIAIGGGATDFLSAVGKYEYIHTAVNTDRIRIQCQNSFIGSVDNLSIKQITSASNQIQKREISSGAFGDELWAITPTDSNNIYNLNSGNVGIGTDDPDKLFVIEGESAQIVINDTASNDTPRLRFRESGTTSGSIFTDESSMVFQTRTDERMRIDSDGNVGIGTTSPSEKLNVRGSVNNDDVAIYIHNAFDDNLATSNPTSALLLGAASNNAYLRLHGAPADTAAKHQIDLGSTAAGSFLTFSPGGAERMRIATDGAIKFNTYGAGTLVTDASGNITASATPPGTGVFVPLAGGAAVGEKMTGTLYGTSTNMSGSGTYAGSMILGNGASTAEAHLSIGQGRTGNGYSYIDLVGDATYQDYGLRVIRSNTGENTTSGIYHRGAGDFSLVATDGADILLIPNAGNVGIGTTSPSSILDIQNVPSGGSGTILNIGLDASNPVRAKIHTESYNGAFSLYDSGSNEDVKITTSGNSYFNGGNVGIGTVSPRSIIEAKGDISIFDPSNTLSNGDTLNGLHFYTDEYSYNPTAGRTNTPISKILPVVDSSGTDSFGLSFYTAASDVESSEKLRISSSGNVGIGTTSPGYKFQVNGGNVAITGGSSSTLFINQNTNQLYGDENGVVMLKANDNIRLHTNSSEIIRINSLGNVGIGTTSPSAKLEVNGQTVINSTGLTEGFQWFNDTNEIFSLEDTSGAGELLLLSSNSVKVKLNANGNSYFNGGNVGIGTTSPYTNFEVIGKGSFGSSGASNLGVEISSVSAIPSAQVKGYIAQATSGAGGGNGDLLIASRTSATTNIRFFAGSTSEKMRIDSSGNVGIGTTSPDATLDVNSGTANKVAAFASTDATAFIQVSDSNTTSTTHGYGVNGNNLSLYANDSEAMRITSSGNVGIGTTSPASHLEIRGSSGGNDKQLRLSTGSTTYWDLGRSGVNGNFEITEDSGNTYFVIDKTSGNVGIGLSSPGVTLHVGGFARLNGGLQMNTTNATIYQILDSALRFGTNNTERMRIDNTGNVGIGTTSPSGDLHVVGKTGSSGRIYISDIDDGTSATDSVLAMKSGTHGYYYNRDGGNLYLGTNNNPNMMIINSSGSVGIGTTSPNLKLDVISGVNNGIRISATDTTNIWRDIDIRSYVSQAQADALPDGSAIYTTNPTSQTETAFQKYGGLVLQGRDDGNSSFAIRLGNGNGYATRMYMGATGATTFSNTVTATNFILSSDERLKENIEKACDNRIKADWKTFELKTDKGQKRYGVIAQELEKTNPEFVREDTQGFKSVAYIDLLIAKIAELEARLEKLEK